MLHLYIFMALYIDINPDEHEELTRRKVFEVLMQ